MKSVYFRKENATAYVFIVACVIGLFFVQQRRINIQDDEKTSTVLSAPPNQGHTTTETKSREITADAIKGDLVATNHRPEAGQAVSFSLKKFTDCAEAQYYFKLGKKKLNFINGVLNYTFDQDGSYDATLVCAFRGKEVVLDREKIHVSTETVSSPYIDLIEN